MPSKEITPMDKFKHLDNILNQYDQELNKLISERNNYGSQYRSKLKDLYTEANEKIYILINIDLDDLEKHNLLFVNFKYLLIRV